MDSSLADMTFSNEAELSGINYYNILHHPDITNFKIVKKDTMHSLKRIPNIL